MGMIRKAASLGTLGIVPWRPPAQRTPVARYARQTRNATRVAVLQNQAMIRQGRKAARVAAAPQPVVIVAPATAPAGWYPDPTDGRCVCWWDGRSWWPDSKRWA